MSEQQQHDWQEMDEALEREFASVIPLVRRHEQQPGPGPSPAVDSHVMQLARTRVEDSLESSWLLGQGPRLILVTLILFAVAMLVLLGF